VLADGRLVRASAEENPDLFWGLRGGGGNMGVVTAFEYRLHPLGPTILGGLIIWDWARAREAMRHYAAFSIAAPDEVDALGILLTSPEGQPAFAVSACYAGPVEEGERVLRRLRREGPPPAQDLVAPVAYVALQSSGDAIFPRGRRYYWKSHFMREVNDAAIEVMMALFARVPSPMSVAALQQVGGMIARVPADATAYAHRDAAYDCIPISIWEDPAQDAANLAWGREFWEAMRPFSTGGVYVNNLGEEGEERVRAAYGANYARLAALKARYDPSNLFRLNQNVRPVQAA
jgi:FAD/FMN-containing dehydrogenase